MQPGTGLFGADGSVTSASTINDGTYTVFYYKTTATEDPAEASVTISGGKVVGSGFYNSIFTIKETTVNKFFYKVQQLTLEEEGTVSISAVEFPCDDSNVSEIAKTVIQGNKYTVNS